MTERMRAVLLESREVPLGGMRGMNVHRALPQRALPMVGAWCFLDRFGPQRTRMRVEPHPHIGLQTVTWPFIGGVHHRDSVGSDALIQPGALNLMTSGQGISHSEYSVGDGDVDVDALQFWVALPDSRRHGEPEFEQHATLPAVTVTAHEGPDAEGTVVMGAFAGVRSPATTHTPIAGAELRLAPGTRVRLPLEPAWEYAVYGIDGDVAVDTAPAGHEVPVSAGRLLHLGADRDGVDVHAPSGARLFVFGGEPFEADIVMWWNFVGRSHDEVVAAREDWEAGAGRFGHVVTHGDERVPAPPLPAVRLTPRRRRD